MSVYQVLLKNNVFLLFFFFLVSPVVPEVSNCPDYPDDFEDSSSDEAEYSNDFDDVEGDNSLKQPMAAKAAAVVPAGVEKDDSSYSDDDFEEDSDEVM